MSFVPSFYVRLLAAGIFLLFISTTSCRKYVNESIDFDGWSFREQRFNMRATDAVTVTYPIVGSGTINISEVRVQTAEPSISSSFTQRDSNGVCLVTLTLHTNNTPSNTYPARISIINGNGSFIERAVTIDVLNFVRALSDTAVVYDVKDTISQTPFRPEWLFANFLYSTKVKHQAGDPVNRFVFTSLGAVSGVGTITNVAVDVDSLTGAMTTPPQSVGLYNYAGHGWLTKSDGYHRIKGHFIYTYQSGSGGNYEGHLSF